MILQTMPRLGGFGALCHVRTSQPTSQQIRICNRCRIPRFCFGILMLGAMTELPEDTTERIKNPISCA